MTDTIQSQAASFFTFHRATGALSAICLLAGSYFASGYTRGMVVAGLVLAGFAYFSK
jgi:hypothetical protein